MWTSLLLCGQPCTILCLISLFVLTQIPFVLTQENKITMAERISTSLLNNTFLKIIDRNARSMLPDIDVTMKRISYLHLHPIHFTLDKNETKHYNYATEARTNQRKFQNPQSGQIQQSTHLYSIFFTILNSTPSPCFHLRVNCRKKTPFQNSLRTMNHDMTCIQFNN